MSETKDKAELLIIANLAEQAERYDGKYGLRFVFPTFSQGSGIFWYLITNQKAARTLPSQLRPFCATKVAFTWSRVP